MPPPEPPPAAVDDRRLLDAARNGDDGAFARLIERHDPILSQLADGLLDGRDTDPLLIESYVRAYRSVGRQHGPPLPWLVRTTYLTCLPEVRRRERRRTGGPGRLPERHPVPSDSPLAGLGPDERAAFILLDRAGLAEADVATALGAPAATVRQLAARARAVVGSAGPDDAAPGDSPVPSEPEAEAGAGIDDDTADGRADRAEDSPGPVAPDDPSIDPPTAPTRPGPIDDADPIDDAGPIDDADPNLTTGPIDDAGPNLPRDPADVELSPALRRPAPPPPASVEAGNDGDRGDDGGSTGPSPIDLHQPDFWPTLGRRLLAERNAPAVKVPDLPAAGDGSSTREPAKAPPVAMQRRAPRSARRRRQEPDSVDGLAVEAKRQRPRRSVRATAARAAVAIVIVLAVAAAVVAVVHLGSGAHTPVRTNSVSELSAGTVAALDVPSVAMTYTRTVIAPGGRTRRRQFSLLRSRNGSFVLIDITDATTVAYDAATDTRRTRGHAADGAPTGSEETGLAAGPPDPSSMDADLPDAELDRALRSLSTVTDVAAVPIKVHGTSAWQLTGPLADDHGLGADRVELIVDQAQLLPIAVEYLDGRHLVREVRFDSVTLNAPAPGPFTIDLTGLGVTPVAHSYRPSTLSAVAAVVGYDPLRPSFLPGGFELTATTVRAAGKVVTLRYQRGMQQIVISTRTSPIAKGHRWPSPFPGAGPAVASVAIRKGLYRDTTAERTEALGSVPALWGTDGHLAFTVWGDLSDPQLVQVVESLH